MKIAKLADLNMYDIGNEYQFSGTILSGKREAYILTFPEKNEDYSNLQLMPLTLPEWEQLLRQLDILETEMFSQDATGLTKKIVRKSQRQIDGYMQWAVFKRDNYTCRYCGREGIPLTVDHIDLYEQGGATIVENLITACKQCNKDRGKMPYDVWIHSSQYDKRSKNVPQSVKDRNAEKIYDLPHLAKLRVQHIRSR